MCNAVVFTIFSPLSCYTLKMKDDISRGFLPPLLVLFLSFFPDFVQSQTFTAPLAALPTAENQVQDAGEIILNARPIIGILAQQLPNSLQESYNETSYIGAAYVKYIEAAGARVVPILINQDDEYYELMFNSTNGLLIPGGAVSLTDSGYAKAGKKLFEMSLNAWDKYQDPYPIWGTCLGFELLALLAVNGTRNLAACWSQDQALPLNLTDQWFTSRIGQAMPEDMTQLVSSKPLTINFHRWCLTPQNFSKFHMEDFWQMLATGHDLDGVEFVAAFEAHNYPIWGTQFHPEKNPYEWTRKYQNIPHSKDAIKVASFFADYFVEEARLNWHAFESRQLEEEYLIYNFNPEFTGREPIDFAMQQVYLF